MNRPLTRNPEELLEFIEYLEAVLEALKAYAKHNGTCVVWQDSSECDCGLNELL